MRAGTHLNLCSTEGGIWRSHKPAVDEERKFSVRTGVKKNNKRLYTIWQGIKKGVIRNIVKTILIMVEEELRYVKNGKILLIILEVGLMRMVTMILLCLIG